MKAKFRPAIVLGFLVQFAGGLSCAQTTNSQAANEPSWPYQFQVAESASAGFGVTQPGLVTVSVSWQGAPLAISLVGPSGPVTNQTGNGRLQLTHQVTSQEVQAGCGWVVSIVPATKSILKSANPPSLATGTINVQHPAVDTAKLAACKQSFSARVTQSQQVKLNELRAKPKGNLTRGAFVLRPASEAIAMKPAVRTASPVSSVGTKLKPTYVRMNLKPGTPPPPSAVITSVSATGGKPGDRITITGTGFNDNVIGNVLMVVTQNDLEWPVDILTWTDKSITVVIPNDDPSDRAAVAAFPGQLYVFSGYGKNSNKVPFKYTPNPPPWHGGLLMGWPQVSPVTRQVSDRYIHDPSGDNSDFEQIWVTHTWGFSFAGAKNTDYFFLQQHLQNGWTIAAIDLKPSLGLCGIVATGGSSYLSDDSAKVGSSDMQIGVHWWFDAMTCQGYTMQVWIQGPWGTTPGHPWCMSDALKDNSVYDYQRCFDN